MKFIGFALLFRRKLLSEQAALFYQTIPQNNHAVVPTALAYAQGYEVRKIPQQVIFGPF